MSVAEPLFRAGRLSEAKAAYVEALQDRPGDRGSSSASANSACTRTAPRMPLAISARRSSAARDRGGIGR